MDPMVWLLKLILNGFLSAGVAKEEIDFVNDNIRKHRKVFWINMLASVFIYFGLRDTKPEAVSTVITSLLAPVMVLGGAWFAISFGGVPKKLIGVAMSTTLWMFVSFVVSLSAMFIAVGFVTSPWLWPILALIYVGVIVGCVQYDTADGLKAGLDDAVLRHSRYAVEFYRKQGINDADSSS